MSHQTQKLRWRRGDKHVHSQPCLTNTIQKLHTTQQRMNTSTKKRGMEKTVSAEWQGTIATTDSPAPQGNTTKKGTIQNPNPEFPRSHLFLNTSVMFTKNDQLLKRLRKFQQIPSRRVQRRRPDQSLYS